VPTNPLIYYDAHCHLQDPRLDAWRSVKRDSPKKGRIAKRVVNGTRPEDWGKVCELGREWDDVIPSVGLHPWNVNTVDKSWKGVFESHVDSGECAVGEIGLDRWVEGYDIEAQKDAFRFQLRLAKECGLPVSIHCLRAWGMLREVMESEGPYDPGFLLHSYGGPKEMVAPFVDLGARFSFSGYFAHENKAKKREAFMAVPMDRLLIETDAPDMLGPKSVQYESLKDGSGEAINSPLNLIPIYDYVAEMRGMDLEELVPIVGKNFRQLFGKWAS